MNAFAQHFYSFVCSISSESRLRLAPTPSGFLHLGNALNFTLNWLAAKYCGGLAQNEPPAKIFLRIDDLDADRKRPEYIQDIFDSLDWLQLDWTGDPVFQSDVARTPMYVKLLNQLREQNLLFACQKSRRDLEVFGGTYPPEFRNQGLDLDQPEVAWRIKTPRNFPIPDFVVRRRDGIPAYQVSSLADDLEMGITHIIRGQDLETSSIAQRFLAEAISADNFLKINFLHHPLVLGEGGVKLSKSAGATSLRAMRDAGENPGIVFQHLGSWLGLEGRSAQELLYALQQKLA